VAAPYLLDDRSGVSVMIWIVEIAPVAGIGVIIIEVVDGSQLRQLLPEAAFRISQAVLVDLMLQIHMGRKYNEDQFNMIFAAIFRYSTKLG
jgi:hypothetical protein